MSIPPTRLYDDDPGLRAQQKAFRKRLREAGVSIRTLSGQQMLEIELLQALKEIWLPRTLTPRPAR